MLIKCVTGGLLLFIGFVGHTNQLYVAVASNFYSTLQQITSEFTASTGLKVVITTHSTGTLYAQILHGAPYDIFLAADQKRPDELVKKGIGESKFTYALGRIALGSIESFPEPTTEDSLKKSFRYLAIPNPELAPYGHAARQVLTTLNLWQPLQKKIVMGENVGHTFSLLATGNVDLGFISLAQALSRTNRTNTWFWKVPLALHDPIRQDAVILNKGNMEDAKRFAAFLKSPDVRSKIRQFGYELPELPR